ncbi:TIGR03546 family protein [Alteromonadaceae bacterium M269]|nr:TIGR03546 family protein [Alteromonadaceae bacterium M269]
MHLLAKFLKALNSEASPWQIAIAITLGMIVGLTPLWRLHNILLLLIVLFFRVNIASFIVSVAVFGAISILLNPVLLLVGDNLLSSESLIALWTGFYNTSIGHLSQFYHSSTMGGLAIGLLLAVPLLFFSRFIVVQYREKIMTWVNKLKIVEVIKSSRFFQIYESIGS